MWTELYVAAPVTVSERNPTIPRSGRRRPAAKSHHDAPVFPYAQIEAAKMHAPSMRRRIRGQVFTMPSLMTFNKLS